MFTELRPHNNLYLITWNFYFIRVKRNTSNFVSFSQSQNFLMNFTFVVNISRLHDRKLIDGLIGMFSFLISTSIVVVGTLSDYSNVFGDLWYSFSMCTITLDSDLITFNAMN